MEKALTDNNMKRIFLISFLFFTHLICFNVSLNWLFSVKPGKVMKEKKERIGNKNEEGIGEGLGKV